MLACSIFEVFVVKISSTNCRGIRFTLWEAICRNEAVILRKCEEHQESRLVARIFRTSWTSCPWKLLTEAPRIRQAICWLGVSFIQTKETKNSATERWPQFATEQPLRRETRSLCLPWLQREPISKPNLRKRTITESKSTKLQATYITWQGWITKNINRPRASWEIRGPGRCLQNVWLLCSRYVTSEACMSFFSRFRWHLPIRREMSLFSPNTSVPSLSVINGHRFCFTKRTINKLQSCSSLFV